MRTSYLMVLSNGSLGKGKSYASEVEELLLKRYYSVGDIVNKWRTETLELEPVPESEGPKLVERLAIPHTYCWSPGLVSKPSDWPSYIGMLLEKARRWIYELTSPKTCAASSSENLQTTSRPKILQVSLLEAKCQYTLVSEASW